MTLNTKKLEIPLLVFRAAGEGELKLLQHLHAAKHWRSDIGGDCTVQPSFLLVGPDADLLLLGLAAGARRCDVLTTDAEGTVPLYCYTILHTTTKSPCRGDVLATDAEGI